MLLHKIAHEALRPLINLNRVALKLRERLSSKREHNAIFVDADVYRNWSRKIIPQNWGDDLNAHLLSPLLKKALFSSPRREHKYNINSSGA